MKLGVLGCGNMARAIVQGIYQESKTIEIFCYTPSQTKAIALANDVEGTHIKAAIDFPRCDFYLIACKPQSFADLCSDFKGNVNESACFISVLAGTTVATIQKGLGVQKICRVMPNTPCLVAEGAASFYFHSMMEPAERRQALSFFDPIAETIELETESLIDQTTAVIGSSPAYFFELANQLEKNLMKYGLAPSDAKRMVAACLKGSGSLLKSSEDSSEELRKKVTSKGGVTAEALRVISESGFEQTMEKALDAALNRTLELAKGV